MCVEESTHHILSDHPFGLLGLIGKVQRPAGFDIPEILKNVSVTNTLMQCQSLLA